MTDLAASKAHQVHLGNYQNSQLDDTLHLKSAQIEDLNALSLCVHAAINEFEHEDVRIEPALANASTFLRLTYEEESAKLSSISGFDGWRLIRDQREIFRPMGILGAEMLEAVASKCSVVFQHPDAITVPTIALLNEALCAFKSYNFSLATVLGWTVCERLQNRAWSNYCEKASNQHGGKELTKSRRDFLNGRDFTASVVSATLELAGEFSTEFRQELDRARKARNRWIHSGEGCTREEAIYCIIAAASAVEHVLSVPLNTNFTLRMSF